MAAVDELSQLKRLILGQEQQSLERLQERVERPATRAQDVAEVLVVHLDRLQVLPLLNGLGEVHHAQRDLEAKEGIGIKGKL